MEPLAPVSVERRNVKTGAVAVFLGNTADLPRQVLAPRADELRALVADDEFFARTSEASVARIAPGGVEFPDQTTQRARYFKVRLRELRR